MTIPAALLASLSDAQRSKTLAWWDSLTTAAQAEFCRLWDTRSEDTALYGITREGEIEWHELPIELRGEFVDPQDLVDEHEAYQSLLEYHCGNHGDARVFLTERVFHLCRAHAAARAVIAAGRLPHDFVCPLADAGCPMRAVLAEAPGKSLRLFVALR